MGGAVVRAVSASQHEGCAREPARWPRPGTRPYLIHPDALLLVGVLTTSLQLRTAPYEQPEDALETVKAA